MSAHRVLRRTLAASLLLVATLAAAEGPQSMDADFAKAVREWTTKPEFLSPLVDHLPKGGAVPSPRDVLGHHVGQPKTLTYTQDLYRYYRALAATSPRVKVLEIGRTDEGRECLVVFVSSEANIRALEAHRGSLARLADPRGLGETEASRILDTAKPIYHLMGGLHSAETGPPEMLMELAYRLAVEDSPLVRKIRDNVIVSLTPAAEPDGRDRYLDWYYRYLIDETDERENSGEPPYWGKYVFHDNNRDINYSQVTMRNLLQWYLKWHPPIMHDLHESVPFLYTFSGQAPQNPSLDPILYGELPLFSNFEMSQAAKYGMPGIWTHAFVDMWSPGYLAFMSSNHNGMVRMYETFGNGGATTMKRKVEPPEGEGGPGRMNATKREWYRPWPPYKEVEWSLRNNTNYMETAVLSGLELTASFPRMVLENFLKKSRNSIESGKTEAPFGYVIPAGQRDPTRVAMLVELLLLQGIEVGEAKEAVKVKEGEFAGGSYLIKRDQPYGRLAKTLLEKQVFPDASLRTYDDTGWTMGLMLQTDLKPIADKAILDVPTAAVHEPRKPGRVTGSGSAGFVIPHRGSNEMVRLRYLLKDVEVRAAAKTFKLDGVDQPAGSFLIEAGSVSARVKEAVEATGLEAIAVSAMPDVASLVLDLPRLAMFSTWGSTQEVGWVRHAFDHFGVTFDLIYKERVRKGSLRRDYDVILVPNQGYGSAKSLVFDVPAAPGGKPLAYTKTDKFPTQGMYGESEDITGGMGLEGAAELNRFVAEGGLLITLASSSVFPAEFGLTPRVDAGRPSGQFYAPGPIVQTEIQKPDHPIFWGYTEKTMGVRYANGPLLRVPEADKGQTLSKFVGGDAGVLSGLMKGADEIKDRPAILDVPVGKGRVLLYATNPCYRWQNHGEFNTLFSAILAWNDLAPIEPPAAPKP